MTLATSLGNPDRLGIIRVFLRDHLDIPLISNTSYLLAALIWRYKNGTATKLDIMEATEKYLNNIQMMRLLANLERLPYGKII